MDYIGTTLGYIECDSSDLSPVSFRSPVLAEQYYSNIMQQVTLREKPKSQSTSKQKP
jgi:hypothetical protein